jgi:protein-tyrosine phosphatase
VKKICFVCLGNIVRSPLAEALFWQQVVNAGAKDQYEVDSAGTSDWHTGEAPDARMRRIAARHGLIYDHRGRQFQRRDLDYFDRVIAMDRDNRAALLAMANSETQRQKIFLLREFDPQGGSNASVPDPYYSGNDGFEEVYQVVERAVSGLFDHLHQPDDAPG